jgi:6-pyruvoyltetrahydropterin/6-carboxytetrahydropterin synthase
MYEVGTARSVQALHVMPGMEGPEGQLHAHDYRLEIVVARRALSAEGWVCDLDVLDAALAQVTARLEGADLEIIRPPEAAAVTVEVFARWLHQTLAPVVAAAGGEELAVRVWGSPVAFGGFSGALEAQPPTSSS